MDVSVIGLGRVGLPLALCFADAGLTVLGIDKDADQLDALRSGRMPFKEPGADELLARVTVDLSAHAADAAQADAIVLTLGTPSFSHIEIDMSDIRSVLDDLLPVLRKDQLLVLRSTVAPGTTEFVAGYLEKHRGFKVGEDFFVAHVPERIAADRFMEEIGTLPCIVGGVGDASSERAARLFERLGAPIVPTTPVQAELAKIWTNILRYTTFALPNLLMMDCERYGANVFDVIDLINRDYPRGGMAMPGLTAGTCLRKDFAFSEERSNAPGMLLGVSRVHESVPLFLVDGVKRRVGSLRERKVAVLGLAFKRDTDDERDSLSHKLVRLLERELADVAVHDPVVATPTVGFDEAVERRRRRDRGDEPQRLLDAGDAAHDRRPRRRRLPRRGPLERVRRRPGLRLRERDRRAAGVSRVLVTGGAGTIGSAVVRRLLGDPDFEVRVSDQREAPDWMREGCEIHTGDLRDVEQAREAIRGCSHVIHLAAIVGGIANFHKLPFTLTEVNNALYNAVFRAAIEAEVERFTYVSSSMVFERAEQFPTTEEYLPDCPPPRSAYGWSKLAGEVYCRAAHDEHGLPFTICRPFNAYGPGEMPEDEPGIAHAVPDLIRKSLAKLRPLPIFGSGEQTRTLTHVDDIADGIVAATASPAGLNEDFNISASEELTVAEIARLFWEACGNDPAELEFEHLPTFAVDVQRRWPSVEKAERLLGWRAQIGTREGIEATARWLAAR